MSIVKITTLGLLFTLASTASHAVEEPDFELEETVAAPAKQERATFPNILRWAEVRHGERTQSTGLNDSSQMSEFRSQLGYQFNGTKFSIASRADLVLDNVFDEAEIDLRELKLNPVTPSWISVSLGRQIISWTLPDILSVNDFFPKDFSAYFMGRDAEGEYMKAPSDALQLNFFSDLGTFDVVYVPRFEPYDLPDGKRLSYYSPFTGAIEGEERPLPILNDASAFEEDVWNTRYSYKLGANEFFLYYHDGFWPIPNAIDASTNKAYYAKLRNYGGSYRGPLFKGIISAELSYYDSLEDGKGDNPLIPNDQLRGLVRVDYELRKNLNITVQYYVEQRQQQSAYENSLLTGMRSEDRNYQLTTVRLTQMLMHQTLTLSFFTFYSPNEKDYYIRLNLDYQPDDHWLYHIGFNHFDGPHSYTRWAQYKENSSVVGSIRYYW